MGILRSSAFRSMRSLSKGAVHFTGGATSNVSLGGIHDSETDFWISLWFKLDSVFNSSSSAHQYLFAKYVGVDDYLVLHLETSNGKLRWFHKDTAAKFSIESAETSWAADTWHHVIASLSSTHGARLVVNKGTAVTDADTDPLDQDCDLVLGSQTDGGTTGLIGEMKEVAIGTDDLSGAEEIALYAGTVPSDADEYLPMNDGGGLTAFDKRASANGTLDSSCSWAVG